MRVPIPLSEAFGPDFEERLYHFVLKNGLINGELPQGLSSPRFINRSVLPHLQKLSNLFKSLAQEDSPEPESYWRKSSHPKNLRLAYLLYYMPGNTVKLAAITAELARLGYEWPTSGPLRAFDLGAGPASSACGFLLGAKTGQLKNLPEQGSWSLMDQDKGIVQLGARWAEEFFLSQNHTGWSVRAFQNAWGNRGEALIPENSPRFNLWTMNQILGEWNTSPEAIAEQLIESWEKHLDDEALILWSDSAHKNLSRKLLAVRKELLRIKPDHYHLLLPCLGEQSCEALAAEEDWCSDSASWWRAKYIQKIDSLGKMDSKHLPMSYLVLAKSKRNKKIEDFLPRLGTAERAYRIVGQPKRQGKDQEFFVCGEDGKFKARHTSHPKKNPLDRGTILSEVTFGTQKETYRRIEKYDSNV